MELSFDRILREDVVFREIKRREAAGRDPVVAQYYKRYEAIYDSAENLRGKLFDKLHEAFFEKFGFAKPLLGVLEEFPEFEGKIPAVMVFKALTPDQEEASLDRHSHRLGLRLCPEHFFDTAHLEAFVRHELKHIADMIDDAFGYGEGEEMSGFTPAYENILRARYRVLWDISVDGRISRAGKETICPKEARFSELQGLYRKLPRAQQRAIFEALWAGSQTTHGEMLEMAKELRVLLQRTGTAYDPDHAHAEATLLPGSLCPLCKFPTFDWWSPDGENGVIDKIRKDFPRWGPEKGACERCVERYQV